MPLIFKHQTGAQRFRIPWGAAAGALVGAVANNALSSKSNGGAGTTTTDKSPWIAAQPLITGQLSQGQALSSAYQAQPLSTQQQNAVNNIYGESDYMRSLIPSLLGQLQDQPVGYDPSNPSAKPQAWNWSGLLGSGPDLNQGSVNAAPPVAAAPAAPAGTFKDQGAVSWDPSSNPTLAGLQSQYTGGYGTFKYGDQPKAGTQAYADMNSYKNYGGSDPLNIYGWNPAPAPITYSPAGGN
jgi:hypothetical protein